MWAGYSPCLLGSRVKIVSQGQHVAGCTPSSVSRKQVSTPMFGILDHTGGNVRAPNNCILDYIEVSAICSLFCIQWIRSPSSQSATTEEYIAPQTRTSISIRKATENDGAQTSFGVLCAQDE